MRKLDAGFLGLLAFICCAHSAASVDLFAVTDDFGAPPESLYRLDTSSAVSTLLNGLGNGDEGEVIVFNPSDGLIYHLSGRGVVNDPVSGSIFESVLPDSPNTVSSITFDGLRGDDPLLSEEPFAAAYSISTGDFLVHDADGWLYRLNTSGGVTQVADLGFTVKGLAFRGSTLYALEDGDSFIADAALQLITLNPNTGAVLGSTAVTLTGVSLNGSSNALAVHPITGELYAIVQGGGQRHFVIIDPDTGEATLIGTVAERFDAFTFRGFFELTELLNDSAVSIDYSASLINAANATLHAGLSAALMVLNGVHQRPLLTQGVTGANCFWARGEIAQYKHDRDAKSDVGEAGVCHELIDDQLLLGIGVGKSYTEEGLSQGGEADLDGQYVVGEISLRLPNRSLMATVNLLYGQWEADILRQYDSFGELDQSFGLADLTTVGARVRLDWVNLLWFSQGYATPYVTYTVAETTVDAFTEVDGAFPAAFDERRDMAHEMRAGVDVRHLLTDRLTLVGLLEGVHHFQDDEPDISGTVGFTPFTFDATTRKSSWARAGVGLEQRIGESALLQLSMNVSSDGRDPTFAGGASVRVGF